MRTLSLFVLMMISMMVTTLLAEEDNAILAAEKTLQAVNKWLERSPDFSKNFFVDSLEQLESLEKALEALEKNPSEKTSRAEKLLRQKMFATLSHVLEAGFFKYSRAEEALESLTDGPLAPLASAYKNKLDTCRLEAVEAAEKAPGLVAHFQETELWLRPELFDNAEALLKMLYRGRLLGPENKKFGGYMWRVKRVILARSFGMPSIHLQFGTISPASDEYWNNKSPKEVFTLMVRNIRTRKESFQAFNAFVKDALQFLATQVSEKDTPAVVTMAKTLISDRRGNGLPGKIFTARALTLKRKIVEKVLFLHKLNPELYLCTISQEDLDVFSDACVQLLEEISSGKREPNWTNPSLALDELEKAYRWYEPHREMQVYISEVMIEVQKLVHETGSTELKGKLLREAVTVIHGFQEETALK